ncbi:MAG: hypothetical protein ACRYHQ_28780, partial [Janthinobacterium lividum]
KNGALHQSYDPGRTLSPKWHGSSGLRDSPDCASSWQLNLTYAEYILLKPLLPHLHAGMSRTPGLAAVIWSGIQAERLARCGCSGGATWISG